MLFRSVVQPDEITMLARVLNQHCEKHGIRSREGREHVASSLLAMYDAGVADDRELAARLATEDDPDRIAVQYVSNHATQKPSIKEPLAATASFKRRLRTRCVPSQS